MGQNYENIWSRVGVHQHKMHIQTRIHFHIFSSENSKSKHKSEVLNLPCFFLGQKGVRLADMDGDLTNVSKVKYKLYLGGSFRIIKQNGNCGIFHYCE